MSRPVPAILVVDDIEANLSGLAGRLRERLPGHEIGTWRPREDEGSPAQVFDSYVGETTEFVVTDYDLTQAVKGLFGLSIIGWCQTRGVPVGEYSRANIAALPREPNLFELRVPPEEDAAVEFVTCIFNGFRQLRTQIGDNPEVMSDGGSLARVLSQLLERPFLEGQFAAYMSRLNSANAALVETLKAAVEGGKKPDEAFKRRLLTYVLGHVLVNSVLKYPGPILSKEVFCAYLTTTSASFVDVKELFETAKYSGPFGEGRHYYWQDDVDRILEDFGKDISSEGVESFGDL